MSLLNPFMPRASFVFLMPAIGMLGLLTVAFVVLQNQIFRAAEDNRKRQMGIKIMEERNKRLVLDLIRIKGKTPYVPRWKMQEMDIVPIPQLKPGHREVAS